MKLFKCTKPKERLTQKASESGVRGVTGIPLGVVAG